jgi:hypothetical protein
LLRIQNDELSGKLRRSKLLHARVSDELSKYRIAEGKAPLLNFDEEQRLCTKVQVSNMINRLQCSCRITIFYLYDSRVNRLA